MVVKVLFIMKWLIIFILQKKVVSIVRPNEMSFLLISENKDILRYS